MRRYPLRAWRGTPQCGVAFVGRGVHLAEIARALEEATGRFRLISVAGPAGIGKTRLVEEVGERARRDGRRVLWATARRDEHGTGFALWRRLARSAGRPLPPMQDAIDEGEVSGVDVVTEAVAAVLTGLAAQTPVLVVLDDLHYADPDSLAVLGSLAVALREISVAVLATVRTGEGADRPEVIAVRPHHLCVLGPLDAAESRELLGAALGDRDDRVPVLIQRAGGNPLHLLELAALGEQAASGVPTGIAAGIADRLAALPEDIRRFVEAGAVLGTDFDADVARAVAGSNPATSAGAGALDGLLVAEPGARLRYRFPHALVRDAVVASMADDARRGVHARTAEILERTGAPAAVVAVHCEHALAPGADVTRAVAAHERAASEAAAARAPLAVVHARERVVALLGRATGGDVGTPSGTPPGERSAALSAALSAAHHALAEGRRRLGGAGPARADHLLAARYAREAGRPDLLALAALGISGGEAGLEVPLHDLEALELLREADAALTGQPATGGAHALVLARLSVAETERSDASARAAMAVRAVELARVSGDDSSLAAALAAWCDAHPSPEHVDERRARAGEIVAMSADPGHTLLGLRLRLVAELEAGDTAAARASAAEFERVALRHDRPGQLFLVPLWQAAFALAGGDLVAAAELNARAAEIGESAGSSHAFALTISQRVVLDMVRGEWGPLRGLLESVLRDHPDLVGPRASLAWVLAAMGEAARSAAVLAGLVADGCAAVARDAEWLPTLALLADAAALSGDAHAAKILRPMLEPCAEVFVVDGLGDALLGVTAGYLAGLAVTMGDHSDAARYLDAAERANAAAGLTVANLRLGATRQAVGNSDAPRGPGRRVRESAAALGVVLPTGARGTPDAAPAVWQEDGAVVRVEFAGRSAQLRAAKGTRIIAELLRRPRTHVAATVLDGRHVRQPPLGPVLDDTAKRAYRRRLRELDDRIDTAVLGGRDAAGEIAERDALVEELARAAGLRGRTRVLDSDVEKSRVNVTKAVAATLRALDDVHPAAAAHLRVALRTGRSCVYAPDPAAEIAWSVTATRLVPGDAGS